MIFEAAKQLNAYPPATWVKVDDTLIGIEEKKIQESGLLELPKQEILSALEIPN